jgi:hypothetical protein
MSEIIDSPNITSNAAPIQNPVISDDSILAKMTAMRNQTVNTAQTGTGEEEKAKESPVAPEGIDNNTSSVEPEVVTPEDESDESQVEAVAPEEVSEVDTTEGDVIDFVDFAKTNPTAKFKFMRNGKEMIIDAKQAQAILGQGGAIHEEARELKIQKAEFEEYLQDQRAQQEGLTLALEFTVRPQLQKAYDEVKKVQGYQAVFNQQLEQARQYGDEARVAELEGHIENNNAYIQRHAEIIRQMKPKVEQFYDIRKQQVNEVLERNRKAFTDKELRNEYVYNELRDKVSKGWESANNQLVPGIKNIDLISSDEHILSLIRDGLKYREKPQIRSAGSSIAALTNKKTNVSTNSRGSDDLSKLREQAKTGDKKAQDNLLVAQLSMLRQQRAGKK